DALANFNHPQQIAADSRWHVFCTFPRPSPSIPGGEMSNQTVPFTRISLAARYRAIRDRTERLCAPLEPEDYQLQSMPDCSPPKWHLAHTAWFFETFVLAPNVPDYRPFHRLYCYLFNSYYDAVGDRWPRPARGVLSRPTVDAVYAYRRAVDERTLALIE